ncbi:MAG: serine hydrolase [Cyanobacteria bacterium P01_D01_bin.1]
MTVSKTRTINGKEFLTAAESDPDKLGWMKGFPPLKDKTLGVKDGSFLSFPAIRYSASHVQQFLPVVEVSRQLKAPSPLPYDLDDNIDGLTFYPGHPQSKTNVTLTWEESLAANYTDGILILHRGTVVYERYLGALTEYGKHMAMSVSKSFTGVLASILAAEGSLQPERMVADYVPELEDSAFGDATVRQVMDMTTALKYSENYADKSAEVWSYSAAGNPIVTAKSDDGPVGYLNALKEIEKQGEHGEAFSYKTPNADVLGWIVSRVSGKSVANLLSERIWSRIGMEQDGYYQVDALGTPFAGGGLSAGLRDMARFGELVRNQGNWHGEQLFPAAAIEEIMRGGSQTAFAKSTHSELPGWSYKNLWWILENPHGAFAARGVYGQTIYIDPTAEMVLVRFASYPIAANAANDPTSLPAYAAVAEYLIDQK